MQIKSENVVSLIEAIHELRQYECLKITTKYKILKIEEVLMKEQEIAYQLFKELGDKYGENQVDGCTTIKPEFLEIAKKEIDEFNNQMINLPDIYFSLDEFEETKLSWSTLSLLMPFIK